jgi:serine/threonine-protein phosphatase 4 regulatory subunit 1
MLARMLSDQSPEVRTVCSSGLVSLSKCMNAGDLGPHVLTVVLQLAHDDENEEMRMTAAGLLADMCAVIGADLVRQFVAPEIISLAEDPVFRVRKASALNLAKICKIAGPADTKNRLLPAYVRLTRDDMYRVRKACAESLVEMSKVVDSATRRGELGKKRGRQRTTKAATHLFGPPTYAILLARPFQFLFSLASWMTAASLFATPPCSTWEIS